MAAKTGTDGVQHVVHISTDSQRRCRHCDEIDNGLWPLDKVINHYIEVHGYRLLHVGQESYSVSGGVCHHTIAVVGK